MKKLQFKELKDSYQDKTKGCNTGKLGYYYDFSEGSLYRIRCNHYSCKSCRPILKSKLHLDIQREVYRLGFNKHLIMTMPGIEFRKKVTWAQSYPILNYETNKLLHCIYQEIETLRRIQNGYKIKRKRRMVEPFLKDGKEVPDFDIAMIILPRAQAKPKENNPIGFGHNHILTNYDLNKLWLDEKIAMNRYKLGYTCIRDNQNIADYLCKDFFDDDEWVIPPGIKHYRSTRNVKINITGGYKMNPDDTFFKTNDMNFIENHIEKEYFYPLPFEEYVKQFYGKQGVIK